MLRFRFHQFRLLWVILFAACFCIQAAHSQVRVRGYTRKDGTYVAPHYRSAPDGNFRNNWSTSGNVNPYTGRVGTRTSPPPNYGSDVRVRGYTRSNGTYVAPHYRSAPDGDVYNNWSSDGNVNPYSGRVGSQPVLMNQSAIPRRSSSMTESRGSDITSSVGTRPVLMNQSTLSSPRQPSTSLKSRAHNAISTGPRAFTPEVSDGVVKDSVDEVNNKRVSDSEPAVESHEQMATRLESAAGTEFWRLANQFREKQPNAGWLDIAMRISLARELTALGQSVNWRDHQREALSDTKNRIEKAAELRKQGVEVDWEKTSYFELLRMSHDQRTP